MHEWDQRVGVEAFFIHSAGHAWREALERLKMSLQATNVEMRSATA